VSTWFNEFKHQIKKLHESERTRFDDVRRQVGKPAIDELDFSNRLTLDWSLPGDAAFWPLHLYQDEKGQFPERLNKWETATLNDEMSRPGFARMAS